MDEARLAAIQAAADRRMAAIRERVEADMVGAEDEFSCDYTVPAQSKIRAWDRFFENARPDIRWLLAHVGVLRADNQRLRDENEAAMKLHGSWDTRGCCLTCAWEWPCPTARALSATIAGGV